MNEFLPSKKVVAILVIPLLVIFVVFGILNNDKDDLVVKTENTAIDFKSEFSKQPSRVKDTDSDGLFDWEETLYGTDPTNADSDGDNKKDGDEVKDGTDPNINGLTGDDSADNSQIAGSNSLDYRSDPELSKTDVLAKDFLSIYTNLKDSGNLGTPVQDSAVAAVVNRNIDNFFKPKYKSTELNSVGTSEESLEVYETGYNKIFRDASREKEYELFLFARYLETGEDEFLEQLEGNADAMKTVTASLAAMKVPDSALFKHVEVLNSYEVIINIVEEMLKAVEDPVYQFGLANSFALAESELREAIYEMALFFKRNNLQ